MDTGKSLFSRIAGHPSIDPPAADADSEAVETTGFWGWLRGARDRAQMLELRKRDGAVLAVSYGWVDRVEYNPSTGITLHVAGRAIVIAGRNLDAEAKTNIRLLSTITRHRCLWIREANETEDLQAVKGTTVIESITW